MCRVPLENGLEFVVLPKCQQSILDHGCAVGGSYHDVFLEPCRLPQGAKLLKGYRILVMILQDGIEVPAFMFDAEIWKRVLLRIEPRMRVNVHVRRAHEVLQQYIYAVVHMQLVILVVNPRLATVVIYPIVLQMHSQSIQAMDLMENINASNVGLRPKSE